MAESVTTTATCDVCEFSATVVGIDRHKWAYVDYWHGCGDGGYSRCFQHGIAEIAFVLDRTWNGVERVSESLTLHLCEPCFEGMRALYHSIINQNPNTYGAIFKDAAEQLRRMK